ncbi:MAG: type II toxin-antitoxin system PemK/MazF family toxin [Actinomycetota bacterium]|nr:type II toxin-antitoxin system PemK/MazF family toxin [Actinomycetota bacterium]
MRPIHLARLDKSRPVVVLTRELVRPHLSTVTVAPITTTIRGLSTEVSLGAPNGLEERCVIACEHITTIPVAALAHQVGRLLEEQERDLTDAIRAAFDLD